MSFDPEAFGQAMGEAINKAMAPLHGRIAELEKQLQIRPDIPALVAMEVSKAVAALPVAKDGKDCDMAAVKGMVDEAVKAIPAPRDGKDVDLDEVSKMVRAAVEALPKPKDGESISLEDVRPILDDAIKQLRKEADDAIAEPLKLADAMREQLCKALGELRQPEDGKSVTVDDVAPIIKAEVEKAIASIPVPKDGAGMAGAMIDRDGNLNLTMTNGEVKNLGRVVGTDGDDGVSFDAFELEYLPETHEISLKASCVGRTKELRYPAGGLRPGGYWREGTKAKAGEAWVQDGSLWIALKDVSSKPASNADGWIIAARKGRDGETTVKTVKDGPVQPIKLDRDHG